MKLFSNLHISKNVCIFADEKNSYRMKNISQKLNWRWMSGSNLSDNHHCISLHSIGRYLSYPLFLLLIINYLYQPMLQVAYQR